MITQSLLVAFIFFQALTSECSASSFLTDDQIEQATTLAKNSVIFEDYPTYTEEKNWISLEEYSYEYKNVQTNFCIANGFCINSSWGEVTVYAANCDQKKIKYAYGQFSDLPKNSEPILSTVRYEYIPATESSNSYFILEKVEAGYLMNGKGYSQVGVNYFIDKFIKNKTNVTYVFSDLRNPACRHYFPKSGFRPGIPEEAQIIQFKRGMTYPYSWIR